MSHEVLDGVAEHPLKDFEGVYRGIGPTDESAVGMGEIEFTVDSRGIGARWATGLEIQEDFIAMAEARELTAEEIKAEVLNSGAEIDGMRVFDVAGLQWIFFNYDLDPEAAQLLVRGGMGDILGPTVLFNPAQVAQGLHELTFDAVEAELGQPGDLPRLSNGGLAPGRSEAKA